MGNDPRKDYKDFLKTKEKMEAKAQRQKISGYDPEDLGSGKKGCSAKGIGCALILIIIVGIVLAILSGKADEIFRLFR